MINNNLTINLIHLILTTWMLFFYSQVYSEILCLFKLLFLVSEGLLVECSGNSRLWHVSTTSGLASAHWRLSEAFGCGRNVSSLSELSLLLGGAVACSRVKGLLLNWCIGWLRLNVSWWLVLCVHNLILRLSSSHSHW